jgi:hypothetical protein
VDARKEKFDREAAWTIIGDAEQIITAKGKKVQTWDPKTDDRETILKSVMGPSGNLRAPTLKVEKGFLIGFNGDLYERWLRG